MAKDNVGAIIVLFFILAWLIILSVAVSNKRDYDDRSRKKNQNHNHGREWFKRKRRK